ncbi:MULTISPECIES: O-antigen ligase family protein [unclassified Curtobacterium]|uniref:O-antigen ligase family protein n=1 Tax=unclassified Curtobacterium TaxID=257496 RepID=UPI003828E990
MQKILTGFGGVVGTAVAAWAIVASPVALIAVLGVGVVLLLVRRPAWSIYLALILSSIALPAALPTTYDVAGLTLHAHEPFLAVAVMYAVVALPGTRRANLTALAFAGSVVIALLVGIGFHNPLAKVLYDIRPLLECAAAIVVAARVLGTPIASRCYRVLTWVLWISALVTLAGATTGLEIGGRTEDASLTSQSGDASAATRLLTEATFPALAVLCAVVAMAIAGRIRVRDSWALTTPALIIVILSFSRNSILAAAVAVLFAVLATRTINAFMRGSGIVFSTFAAFALLVLLGPVLAQLPGGDFINTQVHSYSDRVINGLNSSVQAADPSIQFRSLENAYLWQSFVTSPVFGHGFGYAYKPSAGTATFLLDYAPYFAHNFYGWLAVKGGVLSVGMLILAIASPLWRSLRQPTDRTLALAAAFVAMLAVSFVAPVALSTNSALLFGGLLGALVASTDPEIRSDTPAEIAGALADR